MPTIKIEYISHMGNDLHIANVARTSFNKWKEEYDSSDERLIKFLAREKHILPFRHPHITLRCEAPIWLARQLGKHQVGMEWSEVSRRYVDKGFEFFEPTYRSRPEGGIKQGSGDVHPDSNKWEAITFDTHANLLAIYDAMIADGVAPEQARGILPQNMMTTWIWTGSLLAFHHMYTLRVDGHAQIEAQQFAKAVSEVIEPLFPVAWAALNGDV